MRRFWSIIVLWITIVAIAAASSASKLNCPAEEWNGFQWPEKAVGQSSIQYCSGIGYYRRICLFKHTSSGPSAVWSNLINMCSMIDTLSTYHIECKGDETWKETQAGQYAYINCPGAYEGYIGRLCTPEGEWGQIKDLCYLPEGRKGEEFEVEL